MEYTGAGIVTFRVKYDGEEIEDYHNSRGEISDRDRVIRDLMPNTVCACALTRRGQATCLREDIVRRMAKRISAGVSEYTDIEEVMRALMKKTGCTDEKCVLMAAQKIGLLSANEAGIEEQLAFKQEGPTDASLFSDRVIQAQLYAWMYQFRNFWAYNFNMLDYSDKCLREGRVLRKPDTLATVAWTDLYKGKCPVPVGLHPTPAAQQMLAAKCAGVRCGACVINSDTYDGHGKHWMALFVDARDTSETPRWTVEFFNSAAIRPETAWLEWMAKTKLELQKCNPRARVETVCVCRIWHQHSKSECGPYSIFYVWARLNDIPAKYFMEHVVPDQMMFEFRQHLFNTNQVNEKFDFAQFSQRVKIRWDTEDIAKDKKRTNI